MTERLEALKRPIVGIVLIDKPSGMTSNRVLQHVKRLFRAAKAGHTGTLDPLATGMLPVCFGAATKVSGLMLSATKRYRVTARCGIATDTGDMTGSEIACSDIGSVDLDALREAVAAMVGWIDQVPPMYSALKYQGKRLYELARSGIVVPRAARRVQLLEIGIEDFAWPEFTLNVHCSKGTYIRTLVCDLAERLGTVAHVRELRRLAVGPYDESQMLSLERLEQEAAKDLDGLDRLLLRVDTALADRPAVTVTSQDAARMRNGCRIAITEPIQDPDPVRVYEADGGFVGLGRFTESGELRPVRIFPA